jgi:hypothetical protein
VMRIVGMDVGEDTLFQVLEAIGHLGGIAYGG